MSNSFSNFMRALMFALLCLALSAGQTFAQSQASTGQITGVVADPNGAVVPNASVTIINKGTNQEQTTTTSEEGIYRFVLLQPATYTVRATSTGFAQQTLDVEVQVGRTVDANFTLGAAATTAEVTVTAESVQTTANNFDAVQNETAINNLPINGRRFQDFVTLTPTAQVDPQRGQISLSGQRGINTNINVDGVDYNQPFFGGIRGGERSNLAFTIPQESIREFQVVAAGYSAEFGRSSGGIVNAVTKTGTNDFTGTAFFLYRPRQLARANDFAQALEDQRLSQIVVNGQQGVDATLAPTQTQFGGSVGGRIIKDKLFFFGSYEQQRFRAPRQVLLPNTLGVTPTAAQTEVFNFYRGLELPFEQTNDAYAGLGRIDYTINSTDRFNVRYNFSRNNALNAVSVGETALDPTTTRALSNNGTEKNRNNIVVAQLINSFGANVVNEVRYQFAREDRPRLANENSANVNTFLGEFGTRNFLPSTQYDVRNQVADALTIISGDHTIKFGGDFSNIYANQDFGFNQFGAYGLVGVGNATGVLNALSASGVPGQLGRFDTTTARFSQQIGNLATTFNVQQLAFFAQDSWRVTPRFTLNYGLRYEKQFNPKAEADNEVLINAVRNAQFPILGGRGFDPTQLADSQDQWGPRLGFAYDPAGDGKTAIRAFAGVYYATTPLLLLAGPFNNFRNPPGDLSVQIGSPFFTSIVGSSSGNFNQALFNQQNPQYTAIAGTGALPNTVFRQFAILGINLNNSSLNSFPALTPQQLQTISERIRNATRNPQANLGLFTGSAPIAFAENYRNPQSFQFGGGIEREVAPNIIVGVDYSQVNTSYLQRNRDVNIPSALTPTEFINFLRANNSAAVFNSIPQSFFNNIIASGRPIIGIASLPTLPTTVSLRTRPVSSLGSVQIRESSARSRFQGLTFRARINRSWGQVNAFYTVSRSLSDDDNERDSGGVVYADPFDLRSEYGPSRLDRTHQFVANPVFFLPYGFEVSSAVRLLSGLPVNVVVGSDLNGDGVTNDRPQLVPGVVIERNAYRSRPVYNVDLRVQKGFNFDERKRLIFSSEFFNVFNFSNVQIGGATTQFCSNTADILCGINGPTNPNFLQVTEQRVGNANFGNINLVNNPGSAVFQVQFGARFQF